MEENKQDAEVVDININEEPQEIPHVNLVICTPGHSVTRAYLKSLLATIAALSEENITKTK